MTNLPLSLRSIQHPSLGLSTMMALFETWFSVKILFSLLGAVVCCSGLLSARKPRQTVKLRVSPLSEAAQRLGLRLLSIFHTLVTDPGSLIHCQYSEPVEVTERPNSARIQDLRPFHTDHEVASTLIELFDKDGAGAWPPKAKHDNWPIALRPYKDIYLELAPLLPASQPSLDDDINQVRREHYRSLMRKHLKERISIAQVQTILEAVEVGNWDIFPRDAYNGFYCCVAVCRHAYR